MLVFPEMTALLAAYMAVLVVVLSATIIRKRFKYQVSLGDGGQDALQRSVRAHGNCLEYTPFALVIVALAEAGGASGVLIAGLAALFALARTSHAVSLHVGSGVNLLRTFGMVGTFTVLLVGAGTLVVLVFSRV